MTIKKIKCMCLGTHNNIHSENSRKDNYNETSITSLASDHKLLLHQRNENYSGLEKY